MSKCCDEHGRCRICKTPTVVKTFRTKTKAGKPITKMGRICPRPGCPNHR